MKKIALAEQSTPVIKIVNGGVLSFGAIWWHNPNSNPSQAISYASFTTVVNASNSAGSKINSAGMPIRNLIHASPRTVNASVKVTSVCNCAAGASREIRDVRASMSSKVKLVASIEDWNTDARRVDEEPTLKSLAVTIFSYPVKTQSTVAVPVNI